MLPRKLANMGGVWGPLGCCCQELAFEGGSQQKDGDRMIEDSNML